MWVQERVGMGFRVRRKWTRSYLFHRIHIQGVIYLFSRTHSQLQTRKEGRPLKFPSPSRLALRGQQLHQMMIEQEELTALKQQRALRRLDEQHGANASAAGGSGGSGPEGDGPGERSGPAERSVALIAVCAADSLGGDCDPRWLLEAGGAGGGQAVVGTLDLYAVKAVPGEVLIGACFNKKAGMRRVSICSLGKGG